MVYFRNLEGSFVLIAQWEEQEGQRMSETEFVPYKKLASSIILTAVEDCQNGQMNEVDRFIHTEWFETLTEIAGIDPANARGKLITGNLVDAKLVRGEVCF